jgi:hypothetical protein
MQQRRARSLRRLKSFIASRARFWWQHPCALGPGDVDHDWEFQDDSFDHEYGTERVHYWRCACCGEERPMEPGDYEDPWL